MTLAPGLKERVQGTLARGLVSLPGPVIRLLTGGATRIDGQVLEPEVQMMCFLLTHSGEPPMESLPPPEARAEIRRTASAFVGTVAKVAQVEERRIPGPAGEMRVRLYRPFAGESKRPLLVYYHGGGWVVGDLDTHDGACRYFAANAGVNVLALDYRLAPEHRFPAAVDDAVAGFRWACAHAEELGSDPSRVAVGGDSAGGNLSAVVARLTTRDGGPRPVFQLLIYPVTDLSTKHESYRLFRDGFFLTEKQMDWYRGHYLPDESAARDPRASPLLADDLAGLPPAYVALSGFDPLRDEGERYARKLEAAGVHVTLRRHDGLIHGFVNATGIGVTSRRAVSEMCAALRAALRAT